jgi:rubrerythrin
MSSLPTDLPADFGAAFGKLSGLSRLEIDDMKLMILLETAGEPLYASLADAVEPEEAKKLLLQNGREETAHAHRLKKAIEILSREPYEIPSLSENPYADVSPMAEVGTEMLRGLVQGEIGGDKLYQTYADNEPNAEVAELFRQNGREESQHAKRVEDVIALLGG